MYEFWQFGITSHEKNKDVEEFWLF